MMRPTGGADPDAALNIGRYDAPQRWRVRLTLALVLVSLYVVNRLVR